MSSTNFHNYRTRILAQIFRAFVIPPIITFFLPLPPSLSFVLCILSIPATISIRTRWASYVQEAEARRLGARLVTRVKGRYPGNIDILLSMLKRLKEDYIFDFHHQIFKQYGEPTLNFRLLWEDVVFTIDENHVKYVLATGFEKFGKGYWTAEKQESFLGNGIFNRDGEEWKAHRALARPFFVHERISDFDTFDEYSNETLAVLDRVSSQPYQTTFDGANEWERSATPVDVQDLFARFTLDTASTFLFGACTDTLKHPLPTAHHNASSITGSGTEDVFGNFAGAFEEVKEQISMRFQYGNLVWPLLEFMQDKTTDSMEVIRAWVDPMVKKAVESRGSTKSEESTTFLGHLAESTDDTDYIRHELLNILLAARDTTAALLTFVTYIFAMHPEIATRLRAEVLENCGTDGTPSYDTLRGMRYMRAVLNETLRLFPPVPRDSRNSLTATVLPPSNSDALRDFPYTSTSQGLYIPRDTTVVYLTLEMQRRQDLWGADADKFDPDRWLDARLERFTANPLMFVPFNAGPRICLGQNFAYNETSYFLVKLLQRYDAFALAPDAQPRASHPPQAWRSPGKSGRQTLERVWFASALTLYAKDGLWLRLRRASDATRQQ